MPHAIFWLRLICKGIVSPSSQYSPIVATIKSPWWLKVFCLITVNHFLYFLGNHLNTKLYDLLNWNVVSNPLTFSKQSKCSVHEMMGFLSGFCKLNEYGNRDIKESVSFIYYMWLWRISGNYDTTNLITIQIHWDYKDDGSICDIPIQQSFHYHWIPNNSTILLISWPS